MNKFLYNSFVDYPRLFIFHLFLLIVNLGQCQEFVSISECVFPFSYFGERYNECIEIEGSLKCKNEQNEIVPCFSQVQLNVTQRRTIQNELCQFPFLHRGENFTDCVKLAGKNVCKTANSNDWQECLPVGQQPVVTPVTTVDGYNCSFPFTYQGLEFTECTEISDLIQCLIDEDDEWHECSTSNKASDLLVNRNTRTTVDGYQCVFPTVYFGFTVDDCAGVQGVVSCKIEEDDEWHECAPQVNQPTISNVPTVKENFCVFPFFYRGLIYNQCIEVSGRFVCQADTGDFEECAPDNSTIPLFDGLKEMDARFTVEGYQCMFPFTYRGNVVRECVEVAGRMSCMVDEDSQWHECAPEILSEPMNRTTTDGYKCSLPLQYRGQILNDCTPIDGKPQCKIEEDDYWHPCQIDSGVVLMSSETRKVTVDGENCVFPLDYSGYTLNECIEINNIMQCKIQGDNDWHECAPEVQIIERTTTDGFNCSFPYTYRGVVIDDCTEIAGQLSCKIEEDNNWHQCADYPQNISQQVQRTTVDGYECVFPSIFRGQVLQDCADILGRMSCQIKEDEKWHECAMDFDPTPSDVLTVDGYNCNFPFVYENLVFTNCVEISNKLQCKIKEDTDFHECQTSDSQLTTSVSKTQVTTDGFNCVFPTIYRGNAINGCIEIAGRLSCRISEDNNWHECATSTASPIVPVFTALTNASSLSPVNNPSPSPLLSAPVVLSDASSPSPKLHMFFNASHLMSPATVQSQKTQVTTDGFICAFPLNFRGEEVYDCVEIVGKMSCKIMEDDNWHECVQMSNTTNFATKVLPPTPNPTPTPTPTLTMNKTFQIQSDASLTLTMNETLQPQAPPPDSEASSATVPLYGILIIVVVLVIVVVAVGVFQIRRRYYSGRKKGGNFVVFEDPGVEQSRGDADLGQSSRGGQEMEMMSPRGSESQSQSLADSALESPTQSIGDSAMAPIVQKELKIEVI